MSGSTTQHTETTGRPQPTRNTGQKIAYAFGNLGQAAFYNTMSTFFITFVTTALFIDVDKTLAKRLIAVITGLVVVIRIAEIFLDPLLGNLVDNTNTRWGRFRPWQFIGGIVPGILLIMVFTGLFGLVDVNTGVVHGPVRHRVHPARRDLLAARHLLLGHDPRDLLRLARAQHVHRARRVHRIHRLQRRHRHRRARRQLVHLEVHRPVGAGPHRLGGVRHHHRRARLAHRVERRVRHPREPRRAARQGRGQRQPHRGVQGHRPERPAPVGGPQLPAVLRGQRRHHRRAFLSVQVRARSSGQLLHRRHHPWSSPDWAPRPSTRCSTVASRAAGCTPPAWRS